MSPNLSFGTRHSRTHRTKRSAFAVLKIVRIVIQPDRRIAPIIVRLVPQFIGRGSTSSSPQRIHACERLIARFAAASSRKTSRDGSTPFSRRRNRRRFCWTSGASKRSLNARAMHAIATCDLSVVVRTDFVTRRTAALRDDLLEQRQVDRREVSAATRSRRNRPRLAFQLHPPLQRCDAKLCGDHVIRLAARFVGSDDSLAQFDRKRCRHGDL